MMGKIENEFALAPIATAKRRRNEKRSAKIGSCGVYFIECAGSDLVKIGRSKNVQRRIADINAAKGAPDGQYAIWGIIECDPCFLVELENAVHKAFADCRQDGEWFRVSAVDAYSTACDAARRVCEGDFRIIGLMNHMTDAPKPNWRDPAQHMWKVRRRTR